MPTGVAAFRWGGIRDLPGQPEHVDDRNDSQHKAGNRKGDEDPHKPHPDDKHHEGVADRDTEHMREGPTEAEIHPRRQQHDVVRPRRDRGDEGKCQKGQKQVGGHEGPQVFKIAILGGNMRNGVAKNAGLNLMLQPMIEIDPISQHILRVLSQEGRISNIDLAERVNLSPSACLRRVQELERRGVIAGYRAIIDPARIGIGFVAYVTVGLSKHTKTAQAEFERLMRAAPQVRECHNITGTVEYLLRVEARDLAAYKEFHTEYLGAFPFLDRLTTMVVMGSPKDERA